MNDEMAQLLKRLSQGEWERVHERIRRMEHDRLSEFNKHVTDLHRMVTQELNDRAER